MGNVGPNAINPSIYKLPYDPVKDFIPVTLTNLVPLMLVVNSASGITLGGGSDRQGQGRARAHCPTAPAAPEPPGTSPWNCS